MASKPKPEKSEEYKNFDALTRRILQVPKEELDAKVREEKKKREEKRKPA